MGKFGSRKEDAMHLPHKPIEENALNELIDEYLRVECKFLPPKYQHRCGDDLTFVTVQCRILISESEDCIIQERQFPHCAKCEDDSHARWATQNNELLICPTLYRKPGAPLNGSRLHE
jgi:hypothetical protein